MHNYMPIMRLHQAEAKALSQLNAQQSISVLPLFEIPPVRLPLNSEESSATPEQRISAHADELWRATHGGRVLIDCSLLDPQWRDPHGSSALELLFDSQNLFRHLVPVLRLGQSAAVDAAIRNIVRQDGLGLGLRLGPDQLNSLTESVVPLLQHMRCAVEEIDLIIDFGLVELDHDYQRAIDAPIVNMPWRTITVAGGSFPSVQQIRRLEQGEHRLHRRELSAWCAMLRNAATGIRTRASFGDYVIEHPIYQPPPDICIPSASIRYTQPDSWLFIKGASIRNADLGGATQWPAYAEVLCRRQEFMGPTYSPGDCYIHQIAAGDCGTGNGATWRQAGVNHHIAVVLRQLPVDLVLSERGISQAAKAAPATSGE